MAAAEAKGRSEVLDAKETEELKVALGYGQGKGAGSARGVSGSAGVGAAVDVATTQNADATSARRPTTCRKKSH